VSKRTFWFLSIFFVLGVIGLIFFFTAEKTAVGTVEGILRDKTVIQKQVTVFKLATSDGEYYLGLEGHENDLADGQRIEATFALRDYVARGWKNNKAIGYHKVKRYRILK